MPNETKSKYNMRAPTTKEKVGDFLRSAYDSVAKQPLARVTDALGLSDLQGIANEDPSAMKLGIMPGPPGAMGKALNKFGMPKVAPETEAIAAQLYEKMGMGGGNRMKSLPPRPTGMMPERAALPTTEIKGHPALPPEFNSTRSSRTAPIDMNDLPSGKIEYLDPDVAEYMNPSRLDAATSEGQRRLRFLTGK